MRRRRLLASVMIALVSLSLNILLANQDAVAKARELYLSADYEGALAILDHVNPEQISNGNDAAAYRIFCLLALDRLDDARTAVRAMVERDPSYRLPEGQASPRMEALFRETRRAVLPTVAQSMYGEAKAAFDQHDPGAAQKFDRLIALLDDPDLKDTSVADLRSVAVGFRNLTVVSPQSPVDSRESQVASRESEVASRESEVASRESVVSSRESTGASSESPVASPATRMASTPLTGPPDRIRITRKGASRLITAKEPPPPGVEPPLPIAQSFPSWSPRGMAAQQAYTGVLEVTIDEGGHVTTVALQQPMQPDFDKALVKAARSWKYKPALFHGAAVPFVKTVEIRIDAEP